VTGDIARLRSLRATLEEMERPGFGPSDDQVIADARSAIGTIEDEWSDDRLVQAYRATDGRPGNVEVDALKAEIERRRLSR